MHMKDLVINYNVNKTGKTTTVLILDYFDISDA
jgi:hypothetical protein